jgi:hypothetical protein
MIAIEAMLPPATPPLEPVTVTIAFEVAGPLNAAALAVIVVVPEPAAVTTPDELTLATAGALEVQVTPVVIVCIVGCFPLP